MSDAPPPTPAESARDLLPGYALGALSREEAQAVEAALAESAELRRELAEFRETNALLALRDETAPDPALKRRLMERVGLVTAESIPVGGRVLAARAAQKAAARGPARMPVGRTITWMALAASVLLALGQTLRVGQLRSALSGRDSTAAALAQRLAAREATLNALLEPGVQLTTLTATGEQPPVVQVFWDRRRGRAILHAFRLPPAPSGRVYQLWLMRKDATPLASRLFDVEPDGHALAENIAVPAGEPVVGFAVSIEPAGGSPQPTTTPILFANAAE